MYFFFSRSVGAMALKQNNYANKEVNEGGDFNQQAIQCH